MAENSSGVQLLRHAFTEFYDINHDLDESLESLTAALEVVGLYQVQGDCHFALADAEAAAVDDD